MEYELIVVDNSSRLRTKMLLKRLLRKKKLEKVIFSKKNLLFAGGNNLAYDHAAKDSTHVLLLNSDVEIKHDMWLQRLLELCPQEGIVSFGLVKDEPLRADGYCMLMERQVYGKYRLDEEYAWFYSITKLQSQVLRDGKRVLAIDAHEEWMHHFGGKSGKAGRRNALGMGTAREVIISWFGGKQIEILEALEEKA